MFGFLRKVFNPTPVGFPVRNLTSTRVFSGRDVRPGEAEALRAIDTTLLHPPADLHSDAGWDLFWQTRLDHRLVLRVERALDAGFCRQQRWALVETMRRNGWRSVLCVGNGFSAEAPALADAGFAVTVLDRSPVVVAVVPTMVPSADASAAFFGQKATSPGGSLECVHGDLFDSHACPGPFEVVIERRTLQLWCGSDGVVEGGECDRGLAAVTARLADPGLFVSHQHLSTWRPGQSRDHFADQWLRDRGFEVASEDAPSEPNRSGRRAWVFVTSG